MVLIPQVWLSRVSAEYLRSLHSGWTELSPSTVLSLMLSPLCFQNLQICSLTHAKALRLISTQTSKSLHLFILLFLLFCSTNSSCFTIQNSNFFLPQWNLCSISFCSVKKESSSCKQGRLGWLFSRLVGLTICDPMDCKTPGFPVLHHLLVLAQTHVHWVSDAIPTISSSVVPFSSCLPCFPASRSFPRRRQWHPTPALLPGKSHGQRSLEGCSPWGRWGSDTTERLHFHFSLWCIGEGNGNPLQCFCLENPRDGGTWWAAVYGVAEGQTWLSDFTFTFHFCALEKEMETHSSVLAWRIPGTGKPGGLPSMGSHRVGHDWSNLAAAAAGLFQWVGSSHQVAKVLEL